MNLAELREFFDKHNLGAIIKPERWRWKDERESDPCEEIERALQGVTEEERQKVIANLVELGALFAASGQDDAAKNITAAATTLRSRTTRRSFIGTMAKAFVGFALLRGTDLDAKAGGTAPTIIPSLSPRNSSRAVRDHTYYIVLHTTEGGFDGAIARIKRGGLANYLVDKEGKIYETIERGRMAKHAGRSLFDGHSNVSEVSVGIEIVGSYKTPFTQNQINSVRALVSWLRGIYRIDDKDVLIHPQVVCDFNRWEKRYTRGRRKDCIQAAAPAMRKQLGLEHRWDYDPDVRAKRISYPNNSEGRWLYSVLYGGAVEQQVAERETVRQTPAKEEEDDDKFEGFMEIGDQNPTAWAIAGREFDAKTTIYFLPDGRVRRGDQLERAILDRLPHGTKLLVGFMDGGHVYKTRTAYSVVGKKWNYPSTFYRLPSGQVLQGSDMTEGSIPPGTIVLFRK